MTRVLHILQLEDSIDDAELVRRALADGDLACEIQVIATRDGYHEALARGGFDVILSDSDLPGFDGVAALEAARASHPGVPFIFVSGYAADQRPARLIGAGEAAYVSKDELEGLAPTIRRLLQAPGAGALLSSAMGSPSERLITAVQQLSLARDLPTVMAIVRQAARELTGADGATFVLRDGDLCYYADEDAIAPLWKGRRFPMSTCISGWVMKHREPVVIEDIFADARIPADAYRPTFVKSLAMVPIRTMAPVGAIGNYWARPHRADAEQVRLLQALADSTSIAIENVRLYQELEQRVQERTAQLEVANKELEAFSYTVSHDLRGPVRVIDAFSQMLLEESSDGLGEQGVHFLERIRHASGRMYQLIDDLLMLARIAQAEMEKGAIDLSRMAAEVARDLRAAAPERQVVLEIEEGVSATGDGRLLRLVLENLLSNAWKYTARQPQARVAFGCMEEPDGQCVYFVQDNGAGFDMTLSHKLFEPFQRLHPESEFSGTGVGLATVQRIIRKHGGRIWAKSVVGEGSTFYFVLS